jgi:hypothetical protein
MNSRWEGGQIRTLPDFRDTDIPSDDLQASRPWKGNKIGRDHGCRITSVTRQLFITPCGSERAACYSGIVGGIINNIRRADG